MKKTQGITYEEKEEINRQVQSAISPMTEILRELQHKLADVKDLIEERYSNREIDEKHHGIEKTLERILDQTTATNGAVGRIQKWKERVMGATYILGFIVLPILTWALLQVVNIGDSIEEGIQNELSNYNVKIHEKINTN